MKPLLLLAVVLLSGCGPRTPPEPPKDDRFVYTYQGVISGGFTYTDIFKDTKTGVQYLLVVRNGNPAVCVLQEKTK